MNKIGYLLIAKSSGPTSHDVIDALRKITGERRVGHAGTLDPFARGLLLVGVGQPATRNLGKFVGLDKRYRVVARLGAVSDTYDRMGRITNYELPARLASQREAGRRITNYESRIKNVLGSFIGKQKQKPPAYSAKKIQGKKAYELARAGKQVELRPQEIEIYDIKLKTPAFANATAGRQNSKLDNACFMLDVHCSSGTYIRSVVHDIGQKLGTGAYAEDLTRTGIGNFDLNESLPLDSLTKKNWRERLITFHTVMATGTFEVFHEGHERYLYEAKKLGERLVVVVARQKRAEELRGRKLRIAENERLARVTALPFVDEAMLGNPNDPYGSVKKVAPDIIALGYDQESFVRALPAKIKEFGFKTKIARIPPYHPDRYKSSLIFPLKHNKQPNSEHNDKGA